MLIELWLWLRHPCAQPKTKELLPPSSLQLKAAMRPMGCKHKSPGYFWFSWLKGRPQLVLLPDLETCCLERQQPSGNHEAANMREKANMLKTAKPKGRNWGFYAAFSTSGSPASELPVMWEEGEAHMLKSLKFSLLLTANTWLIHGALKSWGK